MTWYVKKDVGIRVGRDVESEKTVGFAGPETYDKSANILGSQKYKVES